MKVDFRKIISLFLVVMLIFSGFSGCKTREPEIEEIIDETPVVPPFINLLPLPMVPDEYPKYFENGLTALANEKLALNSDVIGWLRQEGTLLDDVVMFKPVDDNNSENFYYLRRGFNEKYLFAGTYFVDYRSRFEGGREGMSKNNVIYGHSMSDDAYGDLFSPLKRFKEEEYAVNNPYIYFSTLEEDIAWEVFAVFITPTTFYYNTPNPKTVDFNQIVSTGRELSIYDYDVEVGAEDKILTLSTCLYEYNGVKLAYPNKFRYVVMAKMIPSTEELKETASLAINPDAIT